MLILSSYVLLACINNMADKGTAAYVSWSKDGLIQLGIDSYIVNILSDIEFKSKADLVSDLLDQQEEDVALE